MIKILIVTHGPLAQALKESSAMFFGSMSNDVETIGLYPTDNPEDLKEAICEKVEAIDTGDGVLVLVDIFAGSPFNMEALSSCNSMELDQLTTHLADIGRDTIVNLRKALDI